MIIQHMGFIMGQSAPTASGLAAYDMLFGGDLTANDAKALDELFLAV
jgi:hypothetical protein